MWLTQLLGYWSRQVFAPGAQLRRKYQYFRDLLAQDRHCLEKMAEIEEIHYRGLHCDYARVARLCRELLRDVDMLVKSLVALNPLRYRVLKDYKKKVSFYVELALDVQSGPDERPWFLNLDSPHASQELLGGKAHNLALISKKGFPVPRGFCITTRAFNHFLNANNLRPRINEILGNICLDSADLEEYSRQLQQLVLDAEIPQDLYLALQDRLQEMPQGRLAFRSSAFGEDSELSFAGQYESLLNVDRENWVQAYKEVLAGKYSPRALSYRIRAGFPDELLSMAVLVLEMLPARESGVIYTSDVNHPEHMGIYTVSGLGDKLVGGEARAREYFLEKDKEPAPSSDHPAYLPDLHRFALELENYFEFPQDIEWVADQQDRVILVQTRPFHSASEGQKGLEPDLPVLCKGQWASPGMAQGPVFRLRSRENISQIPKDVIVVTPGLYPELTAVLDRISAIIALEGSAASHLATIAREEAVPAVINVDKDMPQWEDGLWVTVDGYRGTVHEGRSQAAQSAPTQRQTWMGEKMRSVLKSISTLNLKDAQSEDFIPQNCRSVHDIIRFTHEMGVREMFSLSGSRGKGLGSSRILELEIPMSFRVLDLEEGLHPSAEKQERITLDQVASKPFQALFQGLTWKSIKWDHSTWHFDWQEFDRMSAGIFDPAKSAALSSYALVARDYMHAQIRFGYHFAVVDSLMSSNRDQNYAQFSFKGGGAREEQKILRLEAIKIVLEQFGFTCFIKGDMLSAETAREDEQAIWRSMLVLGYLLGRTRLLDMSMHRLDVNDLARQIIEEIDAALAL
ncbi:Pyruvate, water dikinase [Desulfonatronospira thiodismutans ASO3-1]|uniref:Phosphoenolpyruvate synthase n=1 Tax=Desulfonatronospira thiodismutans ASO3-1 TaxID=555779 RepID=D6STP9_9BACT|nr:MULTISPECIES: PEP/pyruvate-binding domain-containing protein [Desulfonatronospira]EFI34065.1 Pyruvate, water dikinase [Desulfonatronospira thiodismutans ASO3-1]RQD72824.1 MAG: pyruvate, phosphate dikinase [Desulfonatronospira sp. MSAO_Bac3]